MSDKKFLFEAIDAQRAELCSMADQIFDNPEYEGEEVFASGLLTDYLKKNGFEVEMGVGGFKTAFRAAYSHGEGGSWYSLRVRRAPQPGTRLRPSYAGPGMSGRRSSIKESGHG